MSVTDTRFPALLEQFAVDLQSPNEDTRRRATDELYERIISQYADAPSDVVTVIAEQVQEFVRNKMANPNDVNENRAALLVILCFVCAGQNFYTELSNKLEPTLRGYKQMSVDANLCELVVKLTCILVKGCGRMSIDQFSLDVPKALERISREEQHETRRYSGITILKEIAIAAPSRYYHLITPVEQFFEQLFGTMTDPKQYIREAFAETMQATLVVLIDREREEQKNNNSDITTGQDLTSSNTSYAINTESNTFLKAYNMAYNEAMKCLQVETTTKNKNTQREDRIHGGLLLLNELLRVSDVKFESICQDLIQPYSAPKPKPISYKDVHRSRVALTFERTGPLSPMDIIDNPEQSQIQVQSSLIRSIMLDNFVNICNQVFQYRQQPKSMIPNVLIRILPRLASLDYRWFSHQPYVDATMTFIYERINSHELKERQLAFHALGLMILSDKTSRINDTDSLITTTPLTKDMTKIFECLKQTFIPISSTNTSITSGHAHRRQNSNQSSSSSQQQQQSSINNLLPCRYSSPDSSVFACITMIGEAGPDASKCLDNLLEYLLHCGLNHSLLFCLDKLCSMPLIHTDTKRKIHQGLLENLRSILSNPLAYNPNLTNGQSDIILIALQTLRIFDFEAQAIEPSFIDILNQRFIEHDSVRIRIESIITITHLLRKLLLPPSQASLSTNTTTSLIAANKLRIKIGVITQRILTIGVTDLDPDVRYNVFLTLQDDFKQFLAKSEALELLFFSVHDECHEIRELALSLIGRLSNINPAYVLPPLRHLLLQLLTELEIGCSLSGKEQASRLLGQLIANTPRIVRPYMQSITQALLPLIKLHEQHSNVLIALVRTVGEQAQVCGIDLDQRIHDLFPILINMMQDTSNYRKREVALWTIGQIVESCCYVIEPLQKYPILLDVLLQFLKSEETPFRRETIRVLGFLGAIDPYHVRSSNDPLRSLSYDVNDITLTHRVRDEPDPIEISSNELLVASGAISLHDFYTKMAINVCLRVLKDSNTPQLHLKAVQAISIILQWLGSTCTQYVSLVLPRLLSVVRNTDDRNLVPYFRQINIIIISIKSSITPYVNDVVQLIRDYWDNHSELQILLIQTIEALAAALDSEFRHYIHLLLPFVMKTFRIDTNNVNINQLSSSNPNQDRQLILSQMFSTLNKFGKTLKPHFNVVLPSILDIASTTSYPIKLRQEALDTIEQLADKVFLSDYVSAILQILLRIIRKTTQLQMKCLDIILILAQQMGKHFLVFSSLVSKTMDEMKLQHSKYELYISKLKDSSFVDVQSEIIINSNNLLNQTTGEQKTKDEKMLYTMRTVQLSAHWTQAMQRNAKDLPMWLNKLQQLVLEQSPVYPLRAMGTCLAQVSPSIPRDLFNASFISCWSELNSQDRASLTAALTYVLSVCDKPDVIQIILNLAEFRNHCDLKLKLERQQKGNKRGEDVNLNDTNDEISNDKEKTTKKDQNSDNDDDTERSLINIHLLSEKAFSVRAYAKALRYKEEEFQKQQNSSVNEASITSDIVESLISINHELQQSEAAYGALQYAKHNNIKIKGLWYEKLNQWERALRNYEFYRTNDSSNMDIHMGRMRCMQALGSWADLKDLSSQVWDLTEQIRDEQPAAMLPFTTSLIDRNAASSVLHPSQGMINGKELKKILQQKIAPMATRAAWSLGDLSDMEKYYIHIPDTKFEGAYYRAVDAIRNDNYRQAQDSIDLARELLDVELTTLANESYNRAYSAMINAQLLSELEEAWYYKILPERRQSICEIWQKRMQGNQPIIDDYHRLLLTHSLCLPMAQDLQSWIKLANLCRKSNRLTMADFIFKELAHTVLTDQTNINRDISIVSSNTYQSQTSHHFNVQTTTTPAFSIPSQQNYYHPSLIDQQLVKYEKAKYDWHCLVATRERLLLERQNRKQVFNNENTPIIENNHASTSMPTSSSSASISTSVSANIEITNFKLEQNRQEQFKLIEEMKEMVTKTCLPALDHLRKQAATTTGNVQQQNIITTSGGTTPAITGTTLTGQTQTLGGAGPQITPLLITTTTATPPLNSTAFSLMTTTSLSTSSQPINQREQRLRQLISKCYLRLGTWQHELFGMTDELTLTEIMKNYEHAWTYDESNYKAWNAYAVLNYDAVNHFKQRIQDLSRNNQPLKPPSSPSVVVAADNVTSPSRQQPQPLTPPPTQIATSQQPNLDASNETYPQLTAKMIHCTIPAVKGLLKSILLSKAKHCLQDTLRLLTLWFEYGQYREVHEALVEGIRTVPVEVWLQVLPQLIARIDSPRPLVHQLIRHLLIDVGRQHPQALIYPLVVASKSVVRERELAANRVLNNMREHSHTLVQQAMVVSEELIRISILWHEKWHEGLEEASRQYFGERSIPGMIETLEPLHAAIERGSTTLNERTFLDSYSNDLSQAHECIRRFQRTKDQRELHQAWDLYHQVFKRIHAQLPNITSLELDYVSPRLATHCRDLELAVPGTYEPHKPPITIRSVHSRITVITSKQRPRKISITGSDGFEYVFLLKGHEDLRQDERVMQLFGLVNEFLSANDETRRRNFIIQRYPVIPLAPNNGLLGWVAHCDTFHALIKEHREKARIMLNAEHRYMQAKAPHYDQLPLINKVEVFEYALNLLEGDDLAKILWHKSSSAEIWLDRRSNYTRSLAVMSMVGYILGLGDRHPSNLMLDRASGKVVHIDFGDCFEVAMTREKFPEKIPFRLTRMLRKAMEVTGIDGTFRMTCEHVMDVLRKNRDSLMAVLEAFIHDPLLNWRLLEINNEQNGGTSSVSNKSPQTGQPQQAHYQPHLSTVNEEDNEHESTIGGTAQQQQNVQQQNLVTQPGRTIRAVEIMTRVREKLTGSDFHREQPVDIPTQVELLIKQATSHENLCQSYIGWCPFW
ncbi:unnamed protein product [Adineta steineri]|uniref:Serine/threonine-protein kinase TOR n=1 Tax=Adineta steineri TaxID=433720 RepID=A0A818NLN8_9BILA|nr:unnamed protein product [Adineta steineri]CAF3605753.1 unnamed protein product [Adineta steineri]